MVRRVLLRLILATAMCLAVLVTGVCVAGYLAFRPPAFYSELVARQPRPEEAEAATRHLEQIRDRFLQWHARSLAIQRGQEVVANEQGGGDLTRETRDYNADEDVLAIRFSEDEVNALLASGPSQFDRGDVRDPRIRLDTGKAVLAFTMATPAGEFVLSLEFVPRPAAGDGARFEIAQVRIGRLNLPMSALSRWVPKREVRLHGQLYLDATGPLPELVFRTDQRGEEAARPRSVECGRGEVVVRLTAPKLPGH